MATARNTTTPDSADLRITVTDATGALDAMDAAVTLMASSRYTKDAEIYSHVQEPNGDWTFWAEYKF